MSSDLVARWLDDLERRYLSALTFRELARALRALSSCYVERRTKLGAGAALDSNGKRAAFALFYAPLHFLVVRHVVRSLPSAARGLSTIIDLGCGTGPAGCAWAIESGARKISGTDHHPWAAAEANRTYRALRLQGRATLGNLSRTRLRVSPGTAVIAAYAVNELPPAVRAELLARLLDAGGRGARLLIVEPIARRTAPWWGEWSRAFEHAGGRADDWRFPAALPEFQRRLARAAGLDPSELTARSLHKA